MEILKIILPTLIAIMPTIILTFTNIGEIPDILSKLEVLLENDRAMLWSQLTSKTTQVIESDYCDIATLECIEELYRRYTILKGNHGMDVRIKQVRAIAKKGEK